MPDNQFENSRVAEGTLQPGAQHDRNALNESSSVSRDDVRDGFAEPSETEQRGTSRVLAASTLAGDRVRNPAGEDLGSIDEIMLDLESGRVAYAVLSFGGFLGIGNKLFAVPWSALRIDRGDHKFILDVRAGTLENAPGFDKDNWPDMSDPAFGAEVHRHYGEVPYWERSTTGALRR